MVLTRVELTEPVNSSAPNSNSLPGRPSYETGNLTEQLIGDTIFGYVERIAQKQPTHEAFVSAWQNRRFTYQQLVHEVDRLAKGLSTLGVVRGDRVAIWSTNNIEWFVVFIAVSKLGAILVNVNPGLRTNELEYVLNQSGTKVLFTIVQYRTSEYLSMLSELQPSMFHKQGKDRVQSLEKIIVIKQPGESTGDLLTFDQVSELGNSVSDQTLAEIANTVQFDEPVNIQYTSGTTGSPKGVTLSHHNIINNAKLSALAMKLDAQTRFCVPMPFYHCGGMITSALTTIINGGTTVIPCPYFEADATLRTVESEKCTHLCGVPTMFIADLEHPQFDQIDLSSLRGGFMAGAPCPVEVMKQVAARMHMSEVVILYGLTEASPLILATTTEDSLELRATTVGRIAPGLEVKIIDPATGAVVPRGQQGEVCSRGHGTMIGYWNNPQATADAIDATRWLHSGDLGVMNEAGYVHITGRKKEMIIRGGENVYPREVEEVLHQHPKIAVAQIFGIPHPTLGEDVALWLSLKADQKCNEEEIRQWLKERVAFFKVPRYIVIVSEFPMTVTGKVQKFKMREAMIEELGLQAAAQIHTA